MKPSPPPSRAEGGGGTQRGRRPYSQTDPTYGPLLSSVAPLNPITTLIFPVRGSRRSTGKGCITEGKREGGRGAKEGRRKETDAQSKGKEDERRVVRNGSYGERQGNEKEEREIRGMKGKGRRWKNNRE